jgi:hypothetical protein
MMACAGDRPFPLRDPMTRDTDLESTRVACRVEPTKKDPKHEVCAPETYVSPLIWDGADNLFFRPLANAFAIDPGGEAVNVNSLDEVPDSSWFSNRIGAHVISLDTFLRGACTEQQMLDPASMPDGSWVVDQGKGNGSSPGFRINIPGKGKYLLKSDVASVAERSSAASVIGAVAYHDVGFNTSCEQVVYFRRSLLELTPGLRFKNNSGIERPFDRAALSNILDNAATRDGLIRMQASAWLPGHLLGPFRYEGTRKDDPNDVIPHEDRRELRGGRLLAAWIDHFDAREQNSMDSWIADRKDAPDSSPGQVRHYYLDMSDCLGSEWDWDPISRRLGYSYLLDYGDMSLDFLSLGIITRPWDHIKRQKGREIFGYFNVEQFDPEGWKNEYPNPAFSRMTEHDGAWMARILAHVTPSMVDALAKLGQFTDAGNTAYLATVLNGRLDRILERYLLNLSPIADVHVEGDKLCATDLAEKRGVRSTSAFHYSAREDHPLAVEALGEGRVCIALVHGAQPRYVRVRIDDGVARHPLVAHLYDLVGSFRLVGLERPD